jgi:hypothetical protein
MARLHQAHPALGGAESGWSVRYRRELDMTNDAWRFKARAWMQARGFVRVVAERGADGAWVQRREHGSITAVYPKDLPPGGEYWVAADAAWYRSRGYLSEQQEVGGELREVFIHPEDAKAPKVRKVAGGLRHRIVPSGRYTALYEGRMVHNFDHAAKGYVQGEGRQALWRDLELEHKALIPRVFVLDCELGGAGEPRLAFCDVTGATNERSMLAAIVPAGHASGNKTPTLLTQAAADALALCAVTTSLVFDGLVRLRISTTMNWTYVSRVPVPARPNLAAAATRLLSARLGCLTPEFAELWRTEGDGTRWTYDSAERDPWERGLLRAELDAIVAEAYGLSVSDYARILTGFPLLDRDQPPLPGDAFVTESEGEPRGERGVAWEETPFGTYERKPRSFITRDLALLTYMRRVGFAPPERLDLFYRDVVGIDPEGPLARFRIGENKDLIDRVEEARRAGAVPYMPSGRGGPGEAEAADDDAEAPSDEADALS